MPRGGEEAEAEYVNLFSANCEAAAKALSEASVLLVSTGAGFSADSGLPVYNDIASDPFYSKHELSYVALSTPSMLVRNKNLFYGFWCHCYNLYKSTPAHAGYEILKKWKERISNSPNSVASDIAVALAKTVTVTFTDVVTNNKISLAYGGGLGVVQYSVKSGADPDRVSLIASVSNDKARKRLLLTPVPVENGEASKQKGVNLPRDCEILTLLPKIRRLLDELRVPHDIEPPNFGEDYKQQSCASQGNFYLATSNVDGHFRREGFSKNELYEVHGSIDYWQCAKPCVKRIVRMPSDLRFNINSEKQMTESSKIKEMNCKVCCGPMRPAIVMFADSNCVEDEDSEERFRNWKQSIVSAAEEVSKKKDFNFVVVEIGAGKNVTTIRNLTREFCKSITEVGGNATVIRINPEHPNRDKTYNFGLGRSSSLTDLPSSSKGKETFIGIKSGGLTALQAIDCLLSEVLTQGMKKGKEDQLGSWRWLVSQRSLTIVISFSFVLLAVLTTAGMLWASNNSAAAELGERITIAMITHVRRAVLTALDDIPGVSKQGAALAALTVKSSGGDKLTWEAMNRTAWYQLTSITSFPMITNAGIFEYENEWLIIFRTKNQHNTSIDDHKYFFMPCKECNASQYSITDSSLYLSPDNLLLNKYFVVPQIWRKGNMLKTFSPAIGQESSWGATIWGAAVPPPLLRVFATFIRGTDGKLIGLDYKGVDFLRLQPLLHGVRPEGTKLNPNTSIESRDETRIFLLNEDQKIISATHGGVGHPDAVFTVSPPRVTCWTSLDKVIRGCCHLLEQDLIAGGHPKTPRTVTVDGVRYFFLVRQISDDYGLGLMGCMLLPRNIVYREIEAGVDRSLMAVVFTIITCLVVSIIASYFLTQPLIVMIGKLEQCAFLEVDDIQQEWSILAEINELHKVCRKLASNLLEYKPFIPKAVFLGQDLMKENNDLLDRSNNSNTTPKSGSRSESSGSTVSTRSAAFGAKVVLKTSSGTVIFFRAQALCSTRDRKMNIALTTFLGAVEKVATGCSILIVADVVVVALNTATAVPLHAKSGMAMCKRVVLQSPELGVVASISSGKLAFGNLGCSSIRGHTAVGVPMEQAALMMEVLKTNNCGTSVVCCKVCMKADSCIMALRVSSVFYPNLDFDIYSLQYDRLQSNDELWIEELVGISDTTTDYESLLQLIEARIPVTEIKSTVLENEHPRRLLSALASFVKIELPIHKDCQL